MMFALLSGLLALGVLLCACAFLASLFGVHVWNPALLRVLLALAGVVWLVHLREVWNPVNWGGAIDHTGSWPGLLLFTGMSLLLGLLVLGVGFWLAGWFPLLAAPLPLVGVLAYRWLLTRLLYWRAPTEFYLEDDPYGMWLFLRIFVLTGCLTLYVLTCYVGRGSSGRPVTMHQSPAP
jgi:hypothetical protein